MTIDAAYAALGVALDAALTARDAAYAALGVALDAALDATCDALDAACGAVLRAGNAGHPPPQKPTAKLVPR